MHDPFLKSIFSGRRMIEILIRRHVPEWADEIDFATLRQEPNELVAGQTLERRYPDMIWSANTLDGGRVVILIEFQRTVDPLMALRTTTYAALTLERIASDKGIGVADRLPEFVYLVLYHGDRPWSAPDRVTDLFERSDPGAYRLVPWEGDQAEGESYDDVVALVLGFARHLSPRDMNARIWTLRRAVAQYGDKDLDGFLFEGMCTMLELRGYEEVVAQAREKTMDELAYRFQRGLDEVRQEGWQELLRRQIARKFGEVTAGQLSEALGDLTGLDNIDRVTDALLECATGEEFLERVRTA